MNDFKQPVFLPEKPLLRFPIPTGFDEEGLIAAGGDLSHQRLIQAYSQGIFPWFNEEPILWWSPDPRAIIDDASLHLSKSLKRRIRNTDYTITRDQAFERVVQACADREEGTWISQEMLNAYLKLHELGLAHSYEVWRNGELIGGLYGVRLHNLFCAESKFHRAVDASKIALAAAVLQLFSEGVQLFDVHFMTDHLQSLGVYEVSRQFYLEQLKEALVKKVTSTPQGSEKDIMPWLRARISAA